MIVKPYLAGEEAAAGIGHGASGGSEQPRAGGDFFQFRSQFAGLHAAFLGPACGSGHVHNIPQELLAEYADSSTEKHVAMVEEIRKKLKFDSLRFQELEDILEAVEVNPCKLCTYCWNGKG